MYKLDEAILELGREEYKEDHQRYLRHINDPKLWPGYDASIQNMVAPLWKKKKLMETA